MSVDLAQATTSGEHSPPERDDITRYIDSLDADDRIEVEAASAAIDLAILLYRSRARRGLSQAAAARLAGLQQQAVSRLERPDVQPRLETVQSYLSALGYALEVSVIDLESGETTATAVLPPRAPRRAQDSSPTASRQR